MNKILIDTMYIEEIFSSEDTPYTDFAQAIDDGKIKGISSVIFTCGIDQKSGYERYRSNANNYTRIKILSDNSCRCGSKNFRNSR